MFTSDYADMQVTYRGPCLNGVCGVAPFLTNAGKAGIDGVEIEATWAPADQWLVEGSPGHPDATDTVEIAQLDDLTTLNLSLRVGPEAGAWNLTAGANNLTDEEYPIAGNSSLTTGSGCAEIAYARPREWSVELRHGF